jgi:hypothetical protein
MLYIAGARGCTSGKDNDNGSSQTRRQMALRVLYPRSPFSGALPEARNKVEAQKAETKIRQEVYDGRYGRPTGETSFEKFVQDVYKPWARDNKRSFENNEKYKMPMICESKSLKGKTFAQISPLLIEKYKKER